MYYQLNEFTHGVLSEFSDTDQMPMFEANSLKELNDKFNKWNFEHELFPISFEDVRIWEVYLPKELGWNKTKVYCEVDILNEIGLSSITGF